MKNLLRCAIITVAHLLFWGDIVKKVKKYIYPFVFSIGFFVFYIILGTIINTLDFEGYGGLGLAILILFAWIFIVLPIYCVKYSKIIIDEKLRFLFPFYNAFILSFFYLIPFSLEDETYIYAFILFVWVALWSFVPLVIRLNSTKKQDDNDSNKTQE